ncbi:MAG: class I SAM-dependent RNA methyltransferase, partial [Huintestinicola sp.]
YKALNIAPGLKRTFSSEKWDCIPQKTWSEERTRAMDNIIRDSDFYAYGYDIDDECVRLSIENCTKAGVKKRVRIEQADIRDFVNESDMVIATNPPYGERLLEIKEAEELYTAMGNVLLADAEHPCSIISPHEDFEKFFGKNASKRRKLYNGMIKCQLFSYYK